MFDPKNLDSLKPCKCRRCHAIVDYVREDEKQWIPCCVACNRDDMRDEIDEPFVPQGDRDE